jgi:hypothetical protein
VAHLPRFHRASSLFCVDEPSILSNSALGPSFAQREAHPQAAVWRAGTFLRAGKTRDMVGLFPAQPIIRLRRLRFIHMAAPRGRVQVLTAGYEHVA